MPARHLTSARLLAVLGRPASVLGNGQLVGQRKLMSMLAAARVHSVHQLQALQVRDGDAHLPASRVPRDNGALLAALHDRFVPFFRVRTSYLP